MKLSSDLNLSGLASSLPLNSSGLTAQDFEEQLDKQLRRAAPKNNLKPELQDDKEKKDKQDKKLEQAVQEFEAFFISQMLKSMRATIPEGGIFERGHKEKMMEEMQDEEMSKSLSKGRGFGLADALYKQLQPPTSHKKNPEISYTSNANNVKPNEKSKDQTKQQSITEIGG